MLDWVVWAIAAAILAAGEAATAALVLGPLALAAALAAIVAGTGAGAIAQLAAFIIGSVAAIGILRPLALRHTRVPPHVRTGTAALIGTSAMVLEEVNRDGGRVKIGGGSWGARPYRGDQVAQTRPPTPT